MKKKNLFRASTAISIVLTPAVDALASQGFDALGAVVASNFEEKMLAASAYHESMPSPLLDHFSCTLVDLSDSESHGPPNA